MNQFATIQQLTKRLRRIEAEITAVRKELKAFPKQQNPLPLIDDVVSYTWVNKATLRKQMQHLFLTFSIQGEPVGAELLQGQMRKAELTANELSQSIITAREE